MDISIKCPFIMEVTAPSQSGKSEWVGKLIKYQETILEDPVKTVFWHSPHGHLPSSLDNVTSPRIIAIKGLPWDTRLDQLEEEEEDDGGHILVVLDDFSYEVKDSGNLTKLYTKGSHHSNISLIQIMQNLFWTGDGSRTRSLNVHYMALMRQQRDQQQIRRLGRQITQNNTEFNLFLESYNHATNQYPYAYLLISFHPRDDKDLLLRTNIFPSDPEPQNMVYSLTKQKSINTRLFK